MYDTKPCEPNPTLSGPSNLTAFEGQGRNHVPRTAVCLHGTGGCASCRDGKLT